MFHWKSLKTRVTLFTLAIFVVGMCSLAFYASTVLRADMERLLGEQQFAATSVVAATVGSDLGDRMRALEMTARVLAPAVTGNPRQLQTAFADRPYLTHLFNGGIFVTNGDGVVIADLPPAAARTGKNYLDREFIVDALKEGKSSITHPLIGKTLNAPVIEMTVPIRDASGGNIGVLTGVINLAAKNFLDNITANRDQKSGGYMLVSAKDRVVIVASARERVMSVMPKGVDRLASGAGGYAIDVDADGQEVLTSVKAVPVADWFLAAALPTAEAFAPIRDMQRRMVLATLLLTLLAGALTWWMLHRQLRPMFSAVKTLATLAKLADAPQAAQPLKVTRNDEIGELIGGFNRLLAALGKREAALIESEARFRGLTQMTSDFYWETDADHRVTLRSASDGKTEAALFARSQLLGQRRWELPSLLPDEAGWQRHREHLNGHLPFREFEIARPRPDGGVRHIALSGNPVFDANGEFKGYRGVGTDISQRKEAEATIKELAFFDHLTGLPNRALLGDRIRQAMTAGVRSKRYGAVLFIDLDDFKTLNDTLGHDMGDLLLKQVAERLTGSVRAGDTVARLGGDEFVVMLVGLSVNESEAAAEAEVMGKKILSALGQTYQLNNTAYHSTPSIGITLFLAANATIDDLMKQADLAMYKSKESGRNTLRFFDPGMETAVLARAALEADLHTAIEKKQFLLHYQPQMGKASNVTGAEALVRWQHPTRGLVSPAEFIPLAEETGLIVALGKWVLETACAQLAAWAMRPETAHLTLAVNVSAEQFRKPDFVEQVLSIVRAAGANPTRLKLELTESVLVENVEDITGKMKSLKAQGVGFSLDDFGTGYSSLYYLKRMPLDQLKIDASFVRDVLHDSNDAAIARTIVALATNLGMAVIAEGVETALQRDFLANAGCNAYQGFFFSRPLPIAGFEEFADCD